MNSYNRSAEINPYRYGSGRYRGQILIECMDCAQSKTVTEGCTTGAIKIDPTRLSDLEIVKQWFKGWRVKGVRGAKRTRCPACVKTRPHRREV